MVFKMEINYNTLVEKIRQTIKNNYDCTILMFFAGEIMMADEDIELENSFSPLLLYFDTVACDDKIRFKEIIDFLYDIICSKRNIDDFDINYILNKEEIFTLINKYKSGFITKNILISKLKKYFYNEDIENIIQLFENRLNIEIRLKS